MFRSLARANFVGANIARANLTRATIGAYRMPAVRFYSAGAGLSRDLAKDRIVELLQGYEKIGKDTEIKEDQAFVQDLGLDSLDVVEVVMELEHEFNIQIPDSEADSLKTVGQTIDYILAQPDSV